MSRTRASIALAVLSLCALPAMAQSFRVQCPIGTITHPAVSPNAPTGDNNSEPPYAGPTQFQCSVTGGCQDRFGNTNPSANTAGFLVPTAANGAIKCQQVSGGDGYSTMADGTQTFMFAFGPLSGLADIAAGHPGTEFPSVFNTAYSGTLVPGDPATTDGATAGNKPWTGYSPGAPFPGDSNPSTLPFGYNGAVGLANDVAQTVTVANLVQGALPSGSTAGTCTAPAAGSNTVTAWTDTPSGFVANQQIVISNATAEGGTTTPAGYLSAPGVPWTVTCVSSTSGMAPDGYNEYPFQYIPAATGLPADTGNDVAAIASTPPALDGHVDPRPIINTGVMNGNVPGPLVAFDEDDEMFLTLTNVGMIMRPDLFEQHTIHFHGYPNASSVYDGVPDASVAINIGASFTYYYLAPDAGTYFWHCHITPPEHLQMGMVSQLHVRPRQDRVPQASADKNYNGDLYTYLGFQNGIGLPTGVVADPRTVCNPGADILCSATMPAPVALNAPSGTTGDTGATQGLDLLGNTQRYTYNDGDASTAYDVEYPLQMHGFDPNFHFVGMTFNPEIFVDMKDKYFLLNGRSYPDTVAPGPQASMSSDGQLHYSQPMPAIINIPVGGKALLRMVNLSVSEYHTLQSLGIPMKEVGFMAKLLRDQAGRSTEFYTNSITLGGGESLDVILDASDGSCVATMGQGCGAKLYPVGVYYLYTPQLDHLSNDAENFGGLMTEVHICKSVTGGNTYGNTCN